MEKTIKAFFSKHFTSEIRVDLFPESMIILVNIPWSLVISATFLNQIKDYFDATEVQFQCLWNEDMCEERQYNSEFTIFTRNNKFFY